MSTVSAENFSFLDSEPRTFDLGCIRIRLQVVEDQFAAMWVVDAEGNRVSNPEGYEVINMSTSLPCRPRSNGEIMISCFCKYEVRLNYVTRIRLDPLLEISMERLPSQRLLILKRY